jgi:O-antigen ligase
MYGGLRAQTARIPKIAYWAFLVLFFFSHMNIGGIIIRLFPQEYPINPIFFAACALFILPWTKGRGGYDYLPAAWTFVIVFSLLGFLGSRIPEGMTLYFHAQALLKLWISLVGFPWLATRAVPDDRVSAVVKVFVFVAALGAIFAIFQVLGLAPDSLFIGSEDAKSLTVEEGRGAGFWINPNNCGAICGLSLFLSLTFPFKSKYVNAALRLIILTGILATLSRGGILGFMLGGTVYAITAQRLWLLIKVFAGMILFVLATILAIGYLAPKSEAIAYRLERIEEMLQGNVAGDATASRTYVWKKAFQEITRDWLIGLGHGSMYRVVRYGGGVGGGLGPHNSYLYMWGNSGILALIAFLFWLYVLVRNAWRCPDRTTRAAMMAASLMLCWFLMFDHSLLTHQFAGPAIAVMVLVSYHNRRYGGKAARNPGPALGMIAARPLPRM